MLSVGLGGNDPRDFRQAIGEHVTLELIEERSALGDVGGVEGSLVESAAGLGILILVEVQEGVVAIVSDVCVIAPAPVVGCIQACASVLIDLPADACVLQTLRVGLPVVAG